MEVRTRQEALSLLGLTYTATKEDAKSAFHKLASVYHPDVNDDEEATAIYLRLQNAYEFLMAEPDAVALGGTVGASNGGRRRASSGQMTGAGKILGSKEELSRAAERRAFREEHNRQEKRLKEREEKRKAEEEERLLEEKRQRIFEDAMARIHAIRAAEITADIIEDVMKKGLTK